MICMCRLIHDVCAVSIKTLRLIDLIRHRKINAKVREKMYLIADREKADMIGIVFR